MIFVLGVVFVFSHSAVFSEDGIVFFLIFYEYYDLCTYGIFLFMCEV